MKVETPQINFIFLKKILFARGLKKGKRKKKRKKDANSHDRLQVMSSFHQLKVRLNVFFIHLQASHKSFHPCTRVLCSGSQTCAL
jgi:hypothetical protein